MALRYKPSKRWRPIVQAALKCGHWEAVGQTTDGGSSGLLRHIATGRTVTYALHDGGNDYNGCRNGAKLMQSICGCQFIEPRGRKRSRKPVGPSGFTLEKAKREHDQFIQSWSERVDALYDERAEEIAAVAELAYRETRAAIRGIPKHLRRIKAIERELANLNSPVAQLFDPFGLEDTL